MAVGQEVLALEEAAVSIGTPCLFLRGWVLGVHGSRPREAC